MSVKLVRISSKTHRPLAIQAATEGVTISAFAERAIRRELQRIKRKRSKAQKVQAATQEGSTTGAGSPAVSGGV